MRENDDATSSSAFRGSRACGSFHRLACWLALAGLGAGAARAQDKSTPMSKIERLNRAPVNKEILRVQLPRPTIVKLPNGLTVILIEDHKLPTVAFTMWITPGQLGDPERPPRPGLVHRRHAPRRHRTPHERANRRRSRFARRHAERQFRRLARATRPSTPQGSSATPSASSI